MKKSEFLKKFKEGINRKFYYLVVIIGTQEYIRTEKVVSKNSDFELELDHYNKYYDNNMIDVEDSNISIVNIKFYDDVHFGKYLTKKELDYRASASMSFGMALECLKDGNKVTRRKWNDKEMYIFIDYGLDYESLGSVDHIKDPHIKLRLPNENTQVDWNMSTADLLADDWEEIDILNK